MKADQLTLWKPMTVAQYVYSRWLWRYRQEHHLNIHPHTAVMMVVKETKLDEDLVNRIIRVQSRWNARRFLRMALEAQTK